MGEIEATVTCLDRPALTQPVIEHRFIITITAISPATHTATMPTLASAQSVAYPMTGESTNNGTR